MIRANSIAGVRIHALGLAIGLAVLCVGVNAQAGDGDGIFGYSMRLKNKDFTTEGGTGSNLVVEAEQKKTAIVPQLTFVVSEPRANVSVAVLGQIYAWFGLWLR